MLSKYYYPPVHLFTLWFSESMLYNLKRNNFGIRKNINVLDVGCGLGYHCQNVLKFGVNEAIGVDISEETINLLNTFNSKAIFSKIDICKDDITAYLGRFDIIFSSDVYEHVHDPDLMLANLNKLLNREGVISLTFPNWDNHGQNQLKNIDEFRIKLAKAGFKNYHIDVIEDYSIPYKVFMKMYSLVQKLSDKLLRIKRVEYQGSGMPESDEFHEMYAFTKIKKIKKYKLLCISVNLMYRIIGNLLKVRAPYLIDEDSEIIKNKRIMLFAKKTE